MTKVNDAEFEPIVYEAMQARPEPRSISNLAYRAMELARHHALGAARRQLEGLLRLRRRSRWVAAVAAVLITLVVFAGAGKVQRAESVWTDSSLMVTETDSVSTLDSWAVSVGLTCELLVVGMILVSAGVTSSRPESAEHTFY